MSNKLPINLSHLGSGKRVLNEMGSKILNEEKMGKLVELREGTGSPEYSAMSFQCECDDKGCQEVISISPEEYRKMHRATKNFIVAKTHVRLDLEEIITSLPNYVLVKKFFPHGKKGVELNHV